MKYLLAICFAMVLRLDGWTQQHHGFIPVRDGKLFFEQSGKGPALVFLHGVCLDHRMWQEQIDFFSEFYTCINLDLRGFGESSLPTSTPYSFHEDIKTLLDSLHIEEPVVLLALSMGGKAAINFSLAYPERTKALLLADVAVDGYRFRDFKLEWVAEVAQKEGVDSANQFFLENPIFSSAKKNKAVYDRLEQMILSYSGWNWTHKNPILGLTPPAIEQLDKIKIPVLIITGEEDIWDFQQIAQILNNNITQSLKKEIKGAGHMCNMEKPEVFNELVFEFLNKGQ